MERIDNRIFKIIQDSCYPSIKIEKMDLNDSFYDLGLDELDVVEIIMQLEEEFNVEIPDNAFVNSKIVRDIFKYVTNKETHPEYFL